VSLKATVSGLPAWTASQQEQLYAVKPVPDIKQQKAIIVTPAKIEPSG
jgi:hypothetical protein